MATKKAELLTMKGLSREVPEVEGMGAEIKQLAKDAKSLLGYGVLAQKAGGLPLQRALVKLEMEVLDMGEVRKYQEQAIEKAYEEGYGTEDEDVYWEKQNIRHYQKPIPEFVLMKAVELKKEVPNVEFIVEEVAVVKDPFLYAQLGQETYYIEVWNEPRFEGRLTKEKKKKKVLSKKEDW